MILDYKSIHTFVYGGNNVSFQILMCMTNLTLEPAMPNPQTDKWTIYIELTIIAFGKT